MNDNRYKECLNKIDKYYKSNPDIDITRTKYNYHIIQAPKYTYGRKIKELIKKYECKTRKDSIRLV